MSRRRKEVGIRRKRNGWQAFVDVDGQFRSKQFAIDTPIAEMRAWRDTQTSTVIAPASGSLAADILAYQRKPEIAARKYIGQVAAHLELWADELGRDRSRQSVTQTEVETVIQKWLAAGLAEATVYHRRTSLGSFYTTTNGGPKAHGHNPVTGTTRPEHYQPVDRLSAHAHARPHHRDDAGRPLRQERHHAAVGRAPRRSRDPGHWHPAGGIGETPAPPLRSRPRDCADAVARQRRRNAAARPRSCRRKGSRPSSRSMLRMHGGGSASRPLVTRSSGPRAGSAARTRRSASTTSGTASGRIRTP